MRSRFTTDPQDSLNAGDEVYTNFVPSLFSAGRGNPLASHPAPVEILGTPALASEAVESLGAQSGPTTVTVLTTGGITINLLFDAAAMAAPASFRAGIQQAASILTAAISDKITVNIKIDYSGTGGGAAAGPDAGFYESYTSIRADLINNATSGDTTFNALPTGSSIQGQSNVAVWNAQLKLWGILGANDTTTDDGSATFATDINPNLLVGVALHELTHAMGRVPYGSAPDIFDLFRFTSAGTRLFSGSASAPAAYFSVDGGNTKLADYGRTSDSSDFLNSGVQGSNDPFNEFYNGGTIQSLSTADKEQLDALGFHTAAPVATTVAIESIGSTSLVQGGNNYFLNSTSGGSGPELSYLGAAVTVGMWSGWAPIAAEQTTGGYDVAWKNAGTGMYNVWGTDSSGNYTTLVVAAVSGNSAALEALETTFHQDLNGDGTIGVPTTAIESIGSTSLVQGGNNYFLNSTSGGSGPELSYLGAAVTVGMWSGWAPIAAEQTTGGYDVAWKNAGTGMYNVWGTDSSGNYTTLVVAAVSGNSAALEALETTFHQDLNGDGTIGVPTTAIESIGSTSLVQGGNNYFLNSTSGGSGPELSYLGAAVTVGMWSGWAPIAAEQTTGGYDVAWKNAGTGMYNVWGTDSSGNYTTLVVAAVSGNSAALEALETTFHQDLNGDGTIGVPTTAIESIGSTSLVQGGNNYFLNSTSGGSGPELSYLGAAVTVGMWSGWAPIAAEQTTGGYDVAWKNAGTGMYNVWGTDSSGNYTTLVVAAVSGNSAALEALETTFHQDLNGDGTIGVPTTTPGNTIQSSSALIAGSSNDSFVFAPSVNAGAIVNGAGVDTTGSGRFPLEENLKLAILLNGTQFDHSHLVEPTIDGLDALGNHDGGTVAQVQIYDMHIGHFFMN